MTVRPKTFSRFVFLFEVSTGVVVFQTWEKVLFYTLMITICIMSSYTTYRFLPSYIDRIVQYFSYYWNQSMEVTQAGGD